MPWDDAPPSVEELKITPSWADAPPSPQELGHKVSDQPMGPDQDSLIDRFSERVQDPARWQALLNNSGPYANSNLVQGDVPIVAPAGAVPFAAKMAESMAKRGLLAGASRIGANTAIGAAQGAANAGEGHRLEGAKAGARFTGGLSAAVEAVPGAGKMVGSGLKKLAGAVTGVPEGAITTYAANTDKINEMIKASGGDISEMTDAARKKLSDGIQAVKRGLNQRISQSVETYASHPPTDVAPILEHLERAKTGLNPNFKGSEIAELDDIIGKIKSEAPTGLASVKSLNEIKQYLQESGKSAYLKAGQIFSRGKEVAQAAKGAGALARKSLNAVSPEIAAANNKLSLIHSVEENLNKNLLTPGKSDSALLAAGAGNNSRNAKMLGKLGDIAGIPALEEAKNLAAAKEFTNPDLLPKDMTGKTVGRMALGAAAGSAAAGKDNRLEGAAIGSALASPAALKGVINAGRFAADLAAPVTKAIGSAASSPAAPALANAIRGRLGIKPSAPTDDNHDREILEDKEFMDKIRKDHEMLESIDNPKIKNAAKKALKTVMIEDARGNTRAIPLYLQKSALAAGGRIVK